MDLERELTRVLRTKDTPLPVPDPVGAVRSGMRRRRRTQQVQVLSAGLAVTVVALGAGLLLGNPLASAPSPPATAPPTQGPPPDASAVPVGFQAQDLSFVTTEQGWALGTAPCGAEQCLVQLVTRDGGATWGRRVASGLPRTCTDTTCVHSVRFADSQVGYAFGPSLFTTSDGGSHWSAQPGPPVFGLEIAGGTVTRVVSRDPGCPGCRFTTQTSDVGAFVWRTTSVSDELRTSAALVRHGSRVAVPLSANPAGGAGDAHITLLLSTDSGTTWHSRQDPCGPPSSNAVDESDTTDLSFGPEGLLVALCTDRQSDGGRTAIRLSTDSGNTFGAPRDLPALGLHIAAAGPKRVVAEAFADGEAVLLLTTDGGRSWSRVASQPQPDGSLNDGFLAFSTPWTGSWVGGDRSAVWRTADGGATWTRHGFR